MVCISSVCAGYAFIAAVSSWLRFLVTKAWLFFLSDQVLICSHFFISIIFFLLCPVIALNHEILQTFLFLQIVAYLMVTSGAAALEILYLAYNGDQKVTWSETCSTYGKFCNRIKIAFVLHALALGCFVILAVISAFRFFSMFDPPPVSSNKEEEEQRT